MKHCLRLSNIWFIEIHKIVVLDVIPIFKLFKNFYFIFCLLPKWFVKKNVICPIIKFVSKFNQISEMCTDPTMKNAQGIFEGLHLFKYKQSSWFNRLICTDLDTVEKLLTTRMYNLSCYSKNKVCHAIIRCICPYIFKFVEILNESQ